MQYTSCHFYVTQQVGQQLQQDSLYTLNIGNSIKYD